MSGINKTKCKICVEIRQRSGSKCGMVQKYLDIGGDSHTAWCYQVYGEALRLIEEWTRIPIYQTSFSAISIIYPFWNVDSSPRH